MLSEDTGSTSIRSSSQAALSNNQLVYSHSDSSTLFTDSLITSKAPKRGLIFLSKPEIYPTPTP